MSAVTLAHALVAHMLVLVAAPVLVAFLLSRIDRRLDVRRMHRLRKQ